MSTQNIADDEEDHENYVRGGSGGDDTADEEDTECDTADEEDYEDYKGYGNNKSDEDDTSDEEDYEDEEDDQIQAGAINEEDEGSGTADEEDEEGHDDTAEEDEDDDSEAGTTEEEEDFADVVNWKRGPEDDHKYAGHLDHNVLVRRHAEMVKKTKYAINEFDVLLELKEARRAFRSSTPRPLLAPPNEHSDPGRFELWNKIQSLENQIRCTNRVRLNLETHVRGGDAEIWCSKLSNKTLSVIVELLIGHFITFPTTYDGLYDGSFGFHRRLFNLFLNEHRHEGERVSKEASSRFKHIVTAGGKSLKDPLFKLFMREETREGSKLAHSIVRQVSPRVADEWEAICMN